MRTGIHRGLLLVLAVVIVAGLAIGCATASPAPSPTTAPAVQPTTAPAPAPAAQPTTAPAQPTAAPTIAPAAAATPAAPAKVRTLRFADIGGATGTKGETIVWMFAEIEKRTNGAIKIQPFWSNALLKQTELLKGTGSGVADIAFWSSTYFPTEQPLMQVFESFPAAKADIPTQVGMIKKVWKEVPAFDEQFTKWDTKFIGIYPVPGHWGFTKYPLNSLADFKGQKTGISGSMRMKAFEFLGAVPVAISTGETLEALRSGLITGLVTNPDTAVRYGWHEPVKYYNPIEINSASALGYIINLNVWKSLTPDVQKVITDVFEEGLQMAAKKHADSAADLEKTIQKVAQKVEFPAGEMEKWGQDPKVAGLATEVATKLDGLGLPGKATIESIRKAYYGQ